MTASIRFLGAAGTVTGSRHLVRAPGGTVLVDAGLFQGAKELRLRNWAPFPVAAKDIDAVVLTHAQTLRIHGEDVPVRARVVTISGFSAHGDRDEVGRWLDTLPRAPRRVFCVHGEPAALAAAAARFAARGWTAIVPRQGDEVALA